MENILEGTKNFIPQLAHVNVVVFVSDVDHKLDALWQEALCQSLYFYDRNFTLNLGLFNVIQIMVSYEKSAILFEAPTVDFNNQTRIKYLLTILNAKLGHDFLALFALLFVLKILNFFH
jgi:hypothetical protein